MPKKPLVLDATTGLAHEAQLAAADLSDGTTGSSGAVVLATGASVVNFSLSGATGSGYIDILGQTSAPAAPASHHIRFYGAGLSATPSYIDNASVIHTLATLGDAQTWTAIQTFSSNGIGTTSTDAIVVTNVTAAAAGAQQQSPRVRWTGQGWKTNSTAASEEVDWVAEVIPVQGAANPTSYLAFSSQVNGGGYTGSVYFFSSGAVGVGSTTDPGASGVLNVSVGFRIGNASTTGHYLRGNGTNYVDSAILAADLPGGFNGFATPANSIGLGPTAGGSAATAIRSDATFAIDVTISPTWTSNHTFSAKIINSFADTVTSGTTVATNCTTTSNPASSSSAIFYGGNFNSNSNAACAQNFTSGTGGLTGGLFQIAHFGTGTLTLGIAAKFVAQARSGGGTVTTLYAAEAQAQNLGANTSTTAAGLHIQSTLNSGGGAVTTNYGIKIEDQTVGGTNYAIFTGSGLVKVGDSTDSTTTSTGSVQTLGGLGVAKAGTFGGRVQMTGQVVAVVTKTGGYTPTANDYLVRCDATTAAFTITLPSTPTTGTILVVKKIDASANAITISGTVDGASGRTLSSQYSSLRVCYNGTNWDIV